jgi:hypothetical protein
VLSSTSRIAQERRSATILSTSGLELTNIIGRMAGHSAKIRVKNEKIRIKNGSWLAYVARNPNQESELLYQKGGDY